MESIPDVKNLIYKFSNCSNILPFIGYYDQVYWVMNQLSVKSSKVWKENEKIIKVKLLKNNIRVHPYFKAGVFIPLAEIKRVFKQI